MNFGKNGECLKCECDEVWREYGYIPRFVTNMGVL